MTVSVSKLRQVYPRLLQHMGDEDRTYLAGALVLQRAEQGEVLLAYGETSDRLLMIAEGDLGVSLPGPDGRPVDLGRRGAGCWVGELGVIEPGPASAGVHAATDATLWVLTHAAFERMRAQQPCAAARVMEEVSRDVAQRLRTCNRVLFRRTAEGRLEMVPRQEAPAGAVARLIHELRDLFDLGVTPAGDGAAAQAPLAAPTTLEALLAAHPSFGRLTPEDRERLVQACDRREFPDGHVLIREGDARDSVYFLLRGAVEVTVRKPRDASFAVDRLMGPGEILGLIALVDRGRRSATCTVRGGLEAAVLTLEGANLLMGTRAPLSCAFQYALASQLARDARNLNESLLQAAAHPEAAEPEA